MKELLGTIWITEKTQIIHVKYKLMSNGLLLKFEIRKIAVWLSLPGHYRVTDEALLAETT